MFSFLKKEALCACMSCKSKLVCECWLHLSRGNINKDGVLTDVKIKNNNIKLAQQ